MRPPILETGTSITRRRRSGFQRGFTLFEILVVVAIVVVTVSAVVFSTTLSRGESSLKRLGSDLGKLVHLLNQEAIFENKNYAISISEERFRVLEYDGENWQQSKQRFFHKISFDGAQRSVLTVEKEVAELAKGEELIPHILILSSGEMTEFEWEIIDHNLQAKVILQGDMAGRVIVLGPMPLADA